jgi:hypothetical protein
VYSKGTQKRYSKAAAKLRAAFLGQCSAVLCTLGVWLVLAGGSTYRVLKGYSQPRRTHGLLLGYPHSGELSPAAAVRSGARACGDARVLGGVFNHHAHGLHVETHTRPYTVTMNANGGRRPGRVAHGSAVRGYGVGYSGDATRTEGYEVPIEYSKGARAVLLGY